MLQFNKYSDEGRTLMVKFTCYRCGESVTIPLSEANVPSDHYGHLHNIDPPKPWDEIPYNKILCPDCLKAYKEFMQPREREG